MKCKKCHNVIPDGAISCPICDVAHPASQPSGFEYAAFISYRHVPRDQEVAKQVQQAIETFTLPREITMQGRTDRSLGKCFRDEDELAASHSLPDRILDALEKSSALIVVCSPEARDSVWINREIDAFIAMHGRERVFAVLAEGSSSESIPDALRTQASIPGGETATPANPLAADFRPEAADKRRQETLRIIAAIAGCSYDDLRQRGRARTMKRRAVIAAAIVIVVAVIAAVLMFANSARQDALIAESRQLAAESAQLLANGDRYGAIQKALQALPASESSNDRPLVPEARKALEDALEINANPESVWWASYEIRTEAPLGLIDNSLSHKTDEEAFAGAIAVSDTGGFFAVSDTNGAISAYDIFTGRKLTDYVMPEEALPLEGGLYSRAMAATEHLLLVANAGTNGTILVCFDAYTGEIVWSLNATGVPSFNTSYGEDYVSMDFPLYGGGYQVIIADLAGDLNSTAKFESTSLVDTSTPYFNTSGERLGTNYAAFGNRLSSLELDSGESNSIELGLDCATSLAYTNGLIIAASAEPMPEDDITRKYVIEAYDEQLNLIWSHEGSFISEMFVDNGITSLVSGEPEIGGTTGDGNIVVSVGREVLVLEASDGSVANQFTFDQTAIKATPSQGAQDDPGSITIVCTNGTVTNKNLLANAQDAEGDAWRLAMPFPIRWAYVTTCGDYDVVLAIPADSENRIVSYRTNYSRGVDSGEELSLDELISMAEVVLAKGGVAA